MSFIVIALSSIVLLAASNMMIFGMKAQTLTLDEFEVQSALRIMTEKINVVSRDAAGAFLLHRDNTLNMTSGWNYIMLNDDQTKLVEYIWDEASGKHLVQDIFSGIEGVTLDLVFTKDADPDEDKLVTYELKLKKNGDERVIDSTVESVNALQVVDRAYGKVANTISYRNDKRITDIVSSQAAVAMVLDTSGSMDRQLNGNTTNNSSKKRLNLMKQEALRLIDELAQNPNVYISLNPFSSTANDSMEMLKAQVNNGTNTAFKNYFDSSSFEADGGTNTGDGIRRGFYRIKEFNEKEENEGITNKNFLIILVDGVTTFGSVYEAYYYDDWYRSGSLDFVLGDANINNRQMPTYSYNRYNDGRYAGNGSDLDPIGTLYVETIGEMVRAYKKDTAEAVQVYVIGFSSVSRDYDSLEDIALATSGEATYYEAGDVETLNGIFKAIGKDISDALWHIGGPN